MLTIVPAGMRNGTLLGDRAFMAARGGRTQFACALSAACADASKFKADAACGVRQTQLRSPSTSHPVPRLTGPLGSMLRTVAEPVAKRLCLKSRRIVSVA